MLFRKVKIIKGEKYVIVKFSDEMKQINERSYNSPLLQWNVDKKRSRKTNRFSAKSWASHLYSITERSLIWSLLPRMRNVLHPIVRTPRDQRPRRG